MTQPHWTTQGGVIKLYKYLEGQYYPLIQFVYLEKNNVEG